GDLERRAEPHAQNGARYSALSMRSVKDCLSSLSVRRGWIRLTSTAAIGRWIRPTMVTSLIVTTRPSACAELGASQITAPRIAPRGHTRAEEPRRVAREPG